MSTEYRAFTDYYGPSLASLPPLIPGRDSGPMEHLQITFENGVTLSLVWGFGAFCSPETVEVAVFNGDGWLTSEVAATFGAEVGDDVDGFCVAECVHQYFLAAQDWKVTS